MPGPVDTCGVGALEYLFRRHEQLTVPGQRDAPAVEARPGERLARSVTQARGVEDAYTSESGEAHAQAQVLVRLPVRRGRWCPLPGYDGWQRHAWAGV